ncbi:MAG: hypothetical protein E7D48_05630 [Bifidobacterium scardovii]|uniref:hypothetical protein n=1 Tax=Bifidobacterium scardovii TaxID=158787 RepID=UPI0020585371|nr:hypothetical protein [Bifidobacterium scardovii]MDU2421569.1 hypothetical protein [Bifidobacterium scardovii]DAZ70544.1 MAG TPA: hypothetical protein [Caudoviricetes sp.]
MQKKTATICYQDGREDTVTLTAKAQCKAEEHAQLNGWGPVEDCKVRFIYYYAYASARMAGKTSAPYEQWLDSIIDVQVNAPDDKDDSLNPTD